jgi:cold shock CspA family protein
VNGVVTSFDEHVGLGEVRGDDGQVFPFHCTQIADGTRIIEAGACVTFAVVPDRPKGPEAYDIVKV